MAKIDKLDLRILEKLDENIRYSSKKIARELKSSRQVIDYRIKRMEKSKIIANYRMLGNFSKLGFIYYRLHIKFRCSSKIDKKKATDYFVEKTYTNWVAECDGKYDLMIGIFTKNVQNFQNVLFSFVSKFFDKIDYYHFVRLLEILVPMRDLNNKLKNRKLRGAVVDQSSPVKLSSVDKKIINVLAKNGKTNIVDISKEIDESIEKVKYHLKKILQNKIMFSNIQYGYNLMGFELYKTLFYLHNPEREKIEKLKKFGRNYPHIWNSQEAQGNWQVEMDIEAKSHEQYLQILDTIMTSFSEIVKNYDTLFIRKEHKFLFAPFLKKD